MVDLPGTMVDLPGTKVDLPGTMVDLPDTMVDLPSFLYLPNGSGTTRSPGLVIIKMKNQMQWPV